MHRTLREAAPPVTARRPARPLPDPATARLTMLQKSVGNAAVARLVGKTVGGTGVVQRVDFVSKMQPKTKEELGEEALQDLKTFHEVLVAKGGAHEYLVELNGAVQARLHLRPDDPRRYTKTLAEVLAEEEKEWMNQSPPPPKSDTHSGKGAAKIAVEAGVLPPETLVQVLEDMRPLKDVGAALSHGEYAHRIQLWIFSRWAKKAGKAEKRAALYRKLLVRDLGGGREENMVPGGEDGPVWSWVLDVPAGDLRFSPEEVGAAAPAFVTTGITKVGHKTGRPSPVDGSYENLRRALLTRRVKRYAQARARQQQLVEAFKKKLEEKDVKLDEPTLAKVTTPPFGKKTFTDNVKDPDVVGWAEKERYWVWMGRTDKELAAALGKIGQSEIAEPLEPLGKNPTEEQIQQREARARRRLEIVEALIKNEDSQEGK